MIQLLLYSAYINISSVIYEYKYRPPLKYFFIGLSGFLMSFIFGMGIKKNDNWASIIFGIFLLITLALGLGFLTIFLRNYKGSNLMIGDDFIEIPDRWKNRINIQFEEISEIAEFEIYDRVIQIESVKGIYQIERNWMKHQDFEDVKKRLMVYWLSN